VFSVQQEETDSKDMFSRVDPAIAKAIKAGLDKHSAIQTDQPSKKV
jgi:hypothetical protein